ncbi:hypothetical protein Clacol_003703 [Clathrus columnatus]|uniref:Arrestin-like N-terminal domain-containing protein n=1 Tax=Clathrus columnatus TaxID=1419009 RepID=A0AAV5A5B3_9AGAM|nr:hypothetical protein Clacol_003703 [Clathrus columnatus]
MTSTLPPPTYEEEQIELFISPTSNAIQFQKGYLGSQGERAAIEGEVQIKGMRASLWQSAFVTLQTIEEDLNHSIEIASRKLVLFSRANNSRETTSVAFPSSLPFSIPLMPDTPQCLHSARSSIKHILTATLQPLDPVRQPLSKRLLVHPKRYAPSNRTGSLGDPRILSRNDPIHFQIEISRTIFHLDDPIPIYVTIPPPEFESIKARGLQLRSVVVDLVRVISSGESYTHTSVVDTRPSSSQFSIFPVNGSSNDYSEKQDIARASSAPQEDFSIPDGLRSIIIRTGASCRLNASRAIRLRLLLFHRTTPMNYDLMDPETVDEESFDCATITQSSLLHNVSFHVSVTITFMYANSHSESKSTVIIPITLLPDVAPLPEVDESVTSAYRKKHDRPPARTVRQEEAVIDRSEAGPSMSTPSGAPPPFDERDAPPPFSALVSYPTPSRLPTFLESESDMNGHLPVLSSHDSVDYEEYVHIPGEGKEFGFNPEDQFDGLSASYAGLESPPPSVNRLDDSVEDYTNLILQSEQHSLTLQLGSETEIPTACRREPPPPPPPLMDDPSDPPPSIYEEEFRRPEGHTPPPLLPPPSMSSPPEASLMSLENRVHPSANAPPPYLHPPGPSEQEETVTRPPPYVDLLPIT